MDGGPLDSCALPLHACALETVPGAQEQVVVGLYELDEAAGSRRGGIVQANVSVGTEREACIAMMRRPALAHCAGCVGCCARLLFPASSRQDRNHESHRHRVGHPGYEMVG
jgi:hypothetical protein